MQVDLNRSSLRKSHLPQQLIPRGLSRFQAAEYIGVSPTKFDELVGDGRMPKPKQIDGRRVWDIRQIDPAFDALMSIEEANPWDSKS